jgi:branched-chain amino acid transport system substrate-binding protein
VFSWLALVSVLAAACAAPAPSSEMPPPPPMAMTPAYPTAPVPLHDLVHVALLVPRSGQYARLGEALLNAAQMALFEAGDPRLEIHVYDTRATPEAAAAQARAAIAAGADVILGPLFSGSVKAVAPLARAAGVPVIAFSNDPLAAAPGVYLMGLQPAQEVARVVTYAAGVRQLGRIAALVPEGDYGEAVLRGFAAGMAQARGEVRAIELYQRRAQGLAEPVKTIADYAKRARWLAEERAFLAELNDDLALEMLDRLANQETLTQPNYDAILIAEGGQLLRTLAPLLAIYEVDPQKIRFLGTGLWNDPGLVREPPLHGAWFAAPPEEGYRRFAARYLASFARPPARVAALGYDAMALIALLARNPMVEERFSSAALTDVNGFAGIGGIFRFAPDGIAEWGFAVLEIRPEGFKVVSPAPQSFVRPAHIGLLN